MRQLPAHRLDAQPFTYGVGDVSDQNLLIDWREANASLCAT
jgi:hypothetical protein